MAETLLTIGADLSQLRRDLAKMPNLANDAAQQTLIKLEKTVAKTEAAAKKAAKSVSKEAKAAARAAEKASGESLKNAEGGLKSIIELSGGSGESVGKITEALALMATPAGAAAIAVGGITIAAAAAGAAIFEAVTMTEQWAKEVAALNALPGFEPVDEDAMASVMAVNDSLEALNMIAKQVGIEFGERFAPALEQGALFAVKLGLVVLDMAAAMGSADEIMRTLAINMTEGLLKGMLGPINGFIKLIEVANEWNRLIGSPMTGAIDNLVAGYDELVEAAAVGLVDAFIDVGEEVMDNTSLFGEYDDRAKELIGTVGKMTEETKKSTKALKEQAEELKGADFSDLIAGIEKWAEALDRIEFGDLSVDYNKYLDEIAAAEEESFIDHEQYLILKAEADRKYAEDSAAINQQRLDAIAASEKAAADAEFALREQKMEHITASSEEAAQIVEAGITFISALQDREHEKLMKRYDDESSAIDEKVANGTMSEEAGAAAKKRIDDKIEAERIKQLQKEKQRALIQAAIDGSLAILKAIASAPPPANIPAIVLTSVGVAAQIGAIAAAPVMHTGGVVKPDEVMIKAQSGESVLTKAATAALGEDRINRYNRGEMGMEGSSPIVVEFNHQVFKSGLKDASRRSRSPLRDTKRRRR